jgi:predicted RNase H-like HicB family nuclease
MQDFLISIQHRSDNGYYVAVFSNGQEYELSANDYDEALSEADQLITEYHE